MARLKKIGIAIIIATAIVIANLHTPSSSSSRKIYSYQSAGGPPTLKQIIDSTGKDLYPQMIAGTLPQFSWFLVFDKLGLSEYAKLIPPWLNVDLSFVYDLLLSYHDYLPTGGILLFKYNFTRLDDHDSLLEYTNELKKYSTKITTKNSMTGEVFEIEIAPFIFSDCVPNNIPKHYCRVFSSDALKSNYPDTKDVTEAVRQYADVTDAYRRINLTSPLGPNVDLSESNSWTAEQTAVYAKEIATYMHSQGVIPTLKHFGYNAKRGDTHLFAYKDDRSLKELMANDFKPYFAVNSLSIPFFIMTTHFFLTSIDKQNVATRSTRVLGFIRGNFPNALVMTDEVSMSGFSKDDTYEQRIAEAKGDVILTHSGLGLDMWSRRAAIYRGALSRDYGETQVSLLKILQMKQKLGLLKIDRKTPNRTNSQ